MANRDNPHGFIPRYHLTGGEISLVEMTVTAANSAIGIGDPLVQVSDGKVDRAAASDVLAGVAAQPKAASAGGTILVYADPNIVFSAQTDDGTDTGTLQTAVNLNANFVAGAPSNDRSIAEIDENSVANTATLPWKIIGLYPAVGNAFGEFNELYVIPNNHKFKGGTGTLGV